MKVYINRLADDDPLTDQFIAGLEELVKKILVDFGYERVEVGIILTLDEHLQKLNRRYRGLDATTDVLAFPLTTEQEAGEPFQAEDETLLLGDVYISLNQAGEQARQDGSSLEYEVALLTVHGVLHLLGYDHDGEEEAKIMKAKEEEILRRFHKGGPAG